MGDKSSGLDKSPRIGRLMSTPWLTPTTEDPSEPSRTDALGLAVPGCSPLPVLCRFGRERLECLCGAESGGLTEAL